MTISRRRAAALLGSTGLLASSACTTAGTTTTRSVPPTRSSTPVPVFNAQRHILDARHIPARFDIDVLPVGALPMLTPQQGAEGQKVPVLFALDGNISFPIVTATAYLLAAEMLPPMLVVGIGYEVDTSASLGRVMVASQAHRNRDYTPSLDAIFFGRQATMAQQLGETYPAYGKPGGAAAFLEFINLELKPFIAQHYPTADLENSAILGDSLGGLFVIHTLLTSPRSFRCYIAGSPSLWWDNQMIFREAASATSADVRVFLSVGSQEENEGMIEPIARLDTLLRTKILPGEGYIFHVFEGETHSSVGGATVSRGVRAVFERDAQDLSREARRG